MVIKNQKEIFFISLTALIVLLDQLTKYLVLKFQPLFDLKLFTLHLVKNTGAGFGVLQDYTSILTIISALVAIVIIYIYPRIPKGRFVQAATALFLAGTLGNLIDRLIRKFVIDFLDFSFWPAFNLADMAITLGAVGLIIYFWKK
ncbi:signal peptidase II [Candidatus Woesearchaeota archaeon]|nr:signal peptidase II [Candidatus Woesearchaeota archaeon]